MMKTFGLVLAMVFVLAGAGTTATIDIYAGNDWNLISAPQVPFDPDPYAVFGDWTIDGSLRSYDAVEARYRLMGDDMGNILLGEGYFYRNYDASGTVTYDAVPDGVPDTGGTMTDMWISLPGVKEPTNLDNGGFHLIGCPFAHNVSLDKIFLTNGTTLKSWADAAGDGWCDPYMRYYDSGYMYFMDGGDDDQMRPGKGYFFTTYKDDLALIILAN